MTEKTFIHHDGALGDVLLSLACIGKIREDAGFLHFAGRPDTAELLKVSGIVDDASSVDNMIYASLYTGSADARAKEFLSSFGRAFVFTVNGDSLLVANIAAAVPRTKAVITIPPDGAALHVAEFRHNRLGIGRRTVDSTPMLTVPPVHWHRAREVLAEKRRFDSSLPLMAMHPGSGGREKCWPLPNYFELVRRLTEEQKVSIVIFSGPAEDYEMNAEINRFADAGPGVIHVRNEKLATVAALINLSRVYLGNDSGITHLAAAVDANVIALFGPTDPLLWKPQGRNVHIVSAGFPGGRIPAITVDEVYERMIPFFRG